MPRNVVAEKTTMRKTKENPRYHVLSVRVSQEERETLEKVSKEANMKLSDLMREALQVVIPWQGTPEQLSHR